MLSLACFWYWTSFQQCYISFVIEKQQVVSACTYFLAHKCSQPQLPLKTHERTPHLKLRLQPLCAHLSWVSVPRMPSSHPWTSWVPDAQGNSEKRHSTARPVQRCILYMRILFPADIDCLQAPHEPECTQMNASLGKVTFKALHSKFGQAHCLSVPNCTQNTPSSRIQLELYCTCRCAQAKVRMLSDACLHKAGASLKGVHCATFNLKHLVCLQGGQGVAPLLEVGWVLCGQELGQHSQHFSTRLFRLVKNSVHK